MYGEGVALVSVRTFLVGFFRESEKRRLRGRGELSCASESLPNNAGGEQETVKVRQSVMCTTPACLSVCLFV